MGLPAVQQRVLDRMEGTLKASEPHLAAMFAIFARLTAGEPVGRESLAARGRRWWLRPGAALSALVLVPVMFAVIITGVLLGGLGFAIHILWWIALIVLVVWVLGFALRVGEGASRSRWYRW